MIYNLTDLAQVAVKNATNIASQLGDVVGSEHILYGLASVSQSKASKLLSAYKVQANDLKDILMSSQD
ncbi:MAG: hypothetical protein J6C90_00435, partial [Clostridia bacterium]|nr:hypothetical protein [Clostridia bacterium]